MAREVHLGLGRARRFREGLASLREGRIEEAISELEFIAAAGGELGESAVRHLGVAHRQAGFAHLRGGRLDKAEVHLRRASELAGLRTDVQDALAHIHARAGQFDRCAEALQQALPLRQDDPGAWRRLAQAQWRCGQRAEAHMTIDTAIRRLGERCDLHIQQGLFHAAEGQLQQARQSLALAAEADADSADAHYYLGLAAAALGSHREAVESLHRAAELRPRQQLFLYHLALAAKAARGAGAILPVGLNCLRPDFGEFARPDFAQEKDAPLQAELVEACLKSYELPLGQRLTAEDRGRIESLLESLRRSLASGGECAEIHGYCADALDLLGRPAEALPHARAAASGASPQALVRLGKLCTRLGLCEEAAGHLQSAVRAGADWADVHAMLAGLLATLGRKPEARSHMELALERNANLRVDERLRARLAA